MIVDIQFNQGHYSWPELRDAARAAEDADRELVAIRLAECDYYLNRHRAARDGLRDSP